MSQSTQYGVRTDTSNVDGIKNWLIVMVSVCSLSLVVDNYLSFGIVVDPVQIVLNFVNFLIVAKWWYFGLICVCCFQQMLNMYIIEKSIILDLISEKTGMILHALNSFYSGLGCSIIFYIFQFNPIAANLLMLYVVFTITKSWSFAFVNMTFRKCQQKEEQVNNVVTEKRNTKLLEYPHNVTLSNIISYMLLTPPVEYQLEFRKTQKKNLNILPISIFKGLLILYVIAIIIYQYVIPEMEKTSLHILQGNYMHVVLCVLKIIFPINLAWLMYFSEFVLNIYLSTLAEIVGMKGVTFQSDWWNTADMKDFWPKWNVPMYVCFKNNIVIPLLRKGYSRSTANLIVVVISGIMHEISLSHPCGIYNGVMFFYFLLQIPAGYVNAAFGKRYGKKYGNLLLWLSLCVTHSIVILIMYHSYKVQQSSVG